MLKMTSERSVFTLLTAVERRLVAAVAADLDREGVTVEQWRVLEGISHREGRSMREIADLTVLPPPTLTKVVDRLVAANLVHRRSDPSDRRRVLVLLTPRGRAMRSRLGQVIQQHESHLEAVIGRSGLGQLGDLLTRLHAAGFAGPDS